MSVPLGHQVVAVQLSAGLLCLELWREVGLQGQTRGSWVVGGAGGGSNDNLDRAPPLERENPLLLLLLLLLV